MAFTWTEFDVGDEKVTIAQLNQVYTNINTGRTDSGMTGSVSSGKTGVNDKVTADDINKVRTEIDILQSGYSTGCTTHYNAYNSSDDASVLTSHNTALCGTVRSTHYSSHVSTHNTSYNSSNNSAVY